MPNSSFQKETQDHFRGALCTEQTQNRFALLILKLSAENHLHCHTTVAASSTGTFFSRLPNELVAENTFVSLGLHFFTQKTMVQLPTIQ